MQSLILSLGGAVQDAAGWTTRDEQFNTAFAFVLVYAALVLAIGNFLDSPYGKLTSQAEQGWLRYFSSISLNLSPRFGWWLMEAPATFCFLYFYSRGENALRAMPLFYAALWSIHYANRGWYFPLNIRVTPGTKGSFNIFIVMFGWLFTSLHAYLNARWFSSAHLDNPYFSNTDKNWLHTWYFIVGFIGYEVSFWLTVHSEYIMRELRPLRPAPNEPRYKIPRGGLFELVTSPQYFTELTAWFFWMIMTRNPGGLVVFLISFGNLVPRAFSQHQWYLDKFPEEYPKLRRKVLVPYLV